MSEWHRRTYGDPCRECGYSWAMPPEHADELVLDAPHRVRNVLSGADELARSSQTSWTVRQYVWHLVDVLRIWAERLAALSLSGNNMLVPWDENRLAEVRGYERMPLSSALWSLERAVGDWHEALRLAEPAGDKPMQHPERGEMFLSDVRRQVAHEVQHHAMDIEQAAGRRFANK